MEEDRLAERWSRVAASIPDTEVVLREDCVRVSRLLTPAAKGNVILRLVQREPKWRATALVLCLLGVVAGVVGLIWVWFGLIPDVWKWGFEPAGWRAIPAVFALLLMAGASLYLPAIPTIGAISILRVYLEARESELVRPLDEADRAQTQIESDSLVQSAEQDPAGLVRLARYSRLELTAYYRIGLTQTQRSFRYSVIAMWIGFVIILSGVIQNVVPLERFGLSPPTIEIEGLIIAGGGVIELISALFLWVYRSSLTQLTYFYNRQMHIHNTLMCYRIASTMDAPDATKSLIVEQVMQRAWTIDRPPPADATGLTKLLGRRSKG